MLLLTLAFVALWILVLNSVFALPKFNLLPYLWRGVGALYAEWVWRVAALLAIGYVLDRLTQTMPHAAYEQWEFYATYIMACVLISLPGYYWGKRG